jgi:formylglycine-generating enzyme
MKDVALVLSRRLLLVISIFPLLVTAPFVISPQVAAEFSSSSQEAIAVELKDAHRQSANNHRTAQTVWTPGGKFSMGSDEPQFPDARPQHRVHVDAFHMDKTLVTNAEYAAFVRATGYVTVAEQVPNAKDYPGASPEKLVVGSVVFAPPATAVALNNQYQWWEFVKGANWRHPEGPQSDLHGRLNHPVVQVACDDAVAYCSWAGGRLPREAEFEYAARRGLERKRYAWGDEFRPGGTFMANTFQGHFPDNNTAEDGYASTSPVGSFPANSYGLYKMAGNAREWTSDWYRPDYYQTLAATGKVTQNPRGPSDSFDPGEPGIPKRVCAADLTCAPTSIAVVTASARVAEVQPTPARTTWVSVAFTTQRGQPHAPDLTQVLSK